MHKLNNYWKLWFHKMDVNEWNIESYHELCKISSLEDAIKLFENISNLIVTNSMIFLMKNNITPLWENEENINGGSFSYKITNEIIINIYKKLIYFIISENLDNVHDIVIQNINGISISPKKNFCILKIWVADLKEINKSEKFKDFIDKSILKMSNDETEILEDPFNIDKILDIDKQICIFRKHKL